MEIKKFKERNQREKNGEISVDSFHQNSLSKDAERYRRSRELQKRQRQEALDRDSSDNADDESSDDVFAPLSADDTKKKRQILGNYFESDDFDDDDDGDGDGDGDDRNNSRQIGASLLSSLDSPSNQSGFSEQDRQEHMKSLLGEDSDIDASTRNTQKITQKPPNRRKKNDNSQNYQKNVNNNNNNNNNTNGNDSDIDEDTDDDEYFDDGNSSDSKLFKSIQAEMNEMTRQQDRQERMMQAQIDQALSDNKKTRQELDLQHDNEVFMTKYVQDGKIKKTRDNLLSTKMNEKITQIKSKRRRELFSSESTRNLSSKEIESQLYEETKGLDLSILTDDDYDTIDATAPLAQFPPERVLEAREQLRKDFLSIQQRESANSFTSLGSLFGSVKQVNYSEFFKSKRAQSSELDKEAYYKYQHLKSSGADKATLLEHIPMETLVWSYLYAEPSGYYDIGSDYSDRYSWVFRQLKINKVRKADIDPQTIRRYSLAYDSYLRRAGLVLPPRQLRQKFENFFTIPDAHREPNYFTPQTPVKTSMPIRIDHGVTLIDDDDDDDGGSTDPKDEKPPSLWSLFEKQEAKEKDIKRFTTAKKVIIYASLPQFNYGTPSPTTPRGFVSPIAELDLFLDESQRLSKQKYLAAESARAKADPNYVISPYKRYDTGSTTEDGVMCNERYYRTALAGSLDKDIFETMSPNTKSLIEYTMNVPGDEYDQYDEYGKLISISDFQSSDHGIFDDLNSDGDLSPSQVKEIFGDVDPLSLSDAELDEYIDRFVRQQAVLSEIAQMRKPTVDDDNHLDELDQYFKALGMEGSLFDDPKTGQRIAGMGKKSDAKNDNLSPASFVPRTNWSPASEDVDKLDNELQRLLNLNEKASTQAINSNRR